MTDGLDLSDVQDELTELFADIGLDDVNVHDVDWTADTFEIPLVLDQDAAAPGLVEDASSLDLPDDSSQPDDYLTNVVVPGASLVLAAVPTALILANPFKEVISAGRRRIGGSDDKDCA